MPRPKANLVILDPGSGRARPDAWVTIYLANTQSLAPLYADDDVTTIPNPVQANGLGQVAVRMNPGIYDISMTWDGTAAVLVEDVVLWTPDLAHIIAPGDIVIGGPDGQPIRLPPGQEGDLLHIDAGLPAWGPLGPETGLPAGEAGSLLVYPPVPDPPDPSLPPLATIAPGTNGQFFVMAGDTPTWATYLPAPPGTLLPINQKGDMVIGAPDGTPARLAVGAENDVLQVTDGTAVWKVLTVPEPPPSMANPMTQKGDLIIGDVGGSPTRLAVGTTSQYLRAAGGGNVHWYTLPPIPQTFLIEGGTVGNQATTGEHTLRGCMIPANSLPAAYHRLVIRAAGFYDGTAATKTIRLYFGGVNLFQTSGTFAGKYFLMECEIWRHEQTLQQSTSYALINGVTPFNSMASAAVDLALAQPLTINVQVSSAKANMINIVQWEVRYLPV
jgi:hypothetical protein